MKVVACVPIKLNNERLPHKNTKILGGKPLINYILSSLDKTEKIDNIYVYCSDDSINKYITGRAEFLRRDKSLDEPTAIFTDIFDKFTSSVNADVYVLAHATAPFITTEIINDCVERVLSGKNDSAFSARKIQEFLWQDNRPLNFEADKIPRSQDLIPIYIETCGLYAFKKEVYFNSKRRIGESPYIREVSLKEAIDIDNPEDFEFASIMLNTKF